MCHVLLIQQCFRCLSMQPQFFVGGYRAGGAPASGRGGFSTQTPEPALSSSIPSQRTVLSDRLAVFIAEILGLKPASLLLGILRPAHYPRGNHLLSTLTPGVEKS